jgi:hypothetical protein
MGSGACPPDGRDARLSIVTLWILLSKNGFAGTLRSGDLAFADLIIRLVSAV